MVILLVVSVLQRSIGFGRGRAVLPLAHARAARLVGHGLQLPAVAAPIVVLGLPGSFGRYLERYRQRGQLRTFLRRTAIWTGSLTIVATTAIVVAAPQFSSLIFGEPDQRTLVLLLAASLVSVILHHFLEAIFAALRKFRIVSAMHVCQSLTFAAISLSLLWWWRAAAESIVIGYGAACLGVGQHHAAVDARPPERVGCAGQRGAPCELLAAAGAVRDLGLVHEPVVPDVRGRRPVHARTLQQPGQRHGPWAQVGNYHASRVVPLLLVSVADLLAGDCHAVHEPRLGGGSAAAGLRSTQPGAETDVAGHGGGRGGRAVGGAAVVPRGVPGTLRRRALAVLPWTLAYCVLYALLIIGQSYIWCAERTRLSTVPLGAGLVANIGLNFALVPVWGLLGRGGGHDDIQPRWPSACCMCSTAGWGMQLQAGTIWLSVAPLVLCGGVWWATGGLVLLVLAVLFSRALITESERALLLALARGYIERLGGWIARRSKPEPVS